MLKEFLKSIVLPCSCDCTNIFHLDKHFVLSCSGADRDVVLDLVSARPLQFKDVAFVLHLATHKFVTTLLREVSVRHRLARDGK